MRVGSGHRRLSQGMFLRLSYSSVRNKWPTAYSPVQSALKAQEQERFPEYLLLRVAPVVLVVVFAAVRPIGCTPLQVHHLVRRVEDPTVDGLEWEVLSRHTCATHKQAAAPGQSCCYACVSPVQRRNRSRGRWPLTARRTQRRPARRDRTRSRCGW